MAVSFAISGQQRLQQAQVAEVLAVRRGVLAHEHDLAHPLAHQPLHLGDDVLREPRDEGAAEGRDRAEGASAVAAGRELDGCDRAAVEAPSQDRRLPPGNVVVHHDGRMSGHLPRGGLPVDRRDGQQVPPIGRRVRDVLLAGHDAAQLLADVRVVVEAEDGIGLRQLVGQLASVALGQAADRHHGRRTAGLLQVGDGEDRVDRVLLGHLDEAAGVDQHGVRVLGIVDQLPAVRREPARHLLGVDLVAGAPEGDDSHLLGAGRRRGHRLSLRRFPGAAVSRSGGRAARR